MTMEVEAASQPEETTQDVDKILDYLTNNEKICFKSQQRGESDLTKKEKTDIATEIFNKSKLSFLLKFGKYLEKNHLDFFQQFTENCDESYEINTVLKEFCAKKSHQINVKNRRYEALKQMIRDDSYFSEVEMMKRNPLLYEQLIGQYLSKEERTERERIVVEGETTLVKVLMEGIERDDAKILKKQQEQDEGGMMEEEEEPDSDHSTNSEPSYSQWGEFHDDNKKIKIKKKASCTKQITAQEQSLLKEEFVSSMYQNFLDGKDEDFDYESVDNNDKYDDTEMEEYDEEDKYFDSEEAETVAKTGEEESEDELDIYMNALIQHPAVSQLTKDIQKL